MLLDQGLGAEDVAVLVKLLGGEHRVGALWGLVHVDEEHLRAGTRDLAAEGTLDDVQHEVEPRCRPARSQDATLVDQDRLWQDLSAWMPARKQLLERPVRRGGPPVEQAGLSQKECARANARQVRAGQVHPPQPRNDSAIHREVFQHVGVKRWDHDEIASAHGARKLVAVQFHAAGAGHPPRAARGYQLDVDGPAARTGEA